MATLTNLNLDPNVQESNGEFTVLPAGKYKMVLINDELKDNRAKTGKILVLKLQVIEGPFVGETVQDNINITNPSPQCQAIGQGTLKRICNLCNVPYPPQDTNGLMGRPMVVGVKVEEFKSNTTGNMLKSNKVTKYESANTPITTINPPNQNNQNQGQMQGQPQAQNASGW